MKKSLSLFFLLFFIGSLQAQEFLEDKLVNYFENDGEVIYTHLNKNHFIGGEVVWFKNYLINRKNNFLKGDVTNLYLSVFDENKQEIDQAIFHVKNGLSFGQIEIDEKFEPGKYYFYFSTNYNNNNQLHHLNHQIIVNVVDQIDKQKPEKDYTKIDFQILPESGYGLYGFSHRYGVKAINSDGVGISFKANLLRNEEVISDFKSNEIGMGVFSLQPQQENNYSLEITTENNKKFTKKIDGFQEKGATISSVLRGGSYFIDITQNLNSTGFRDFKILVHQAGKNFEIDLSNYEKQQAQFNLPAANLFNGVNAITLFYQNQPIAERLIFKHQEMYIDEEDVLIKDQYSESLDSIHFSFAVEKLEDEVALLSTSVLHQNSIAYNPQNNILSKVLLSPYIKGNIENASAYFKDVDYANKYNLDLLLLNQGWSQYNWDKILAEKVIDSTKREIGINQEIKFLQKTRKYRRFFLIFKNLLNQDEVFDLDKTKIIETDDIFPVRGTTYSFSTFDKKGKHYPSPKFKIETTINYPSIDINDTFLNYNFQNKYNQLLEIKAFEAVELLDDVIVKTNKREEKKEYYSSIRGRKVEVTDELAESFPLLADFLRYRGYRVTDTGSQFIIGSRVPNMPPPGVVINGGRIQDLSVLSNRRVDDFDTIEIDRFGYGEGLWGAGGIIRLTFAREMRFQAKYKNRLTEITLEEGYTKPEKFYSPAYTNYDSEKFQMIASLDWQPELVSKDGEFEFSMTNRELTKFIFFIEGLTENGTFFSVPVQHELQSKRFD